MGEEDGVKVRKLGGGEICLTGISGMGIPSRVRSCSSFYILYLMLFAIICMPGFTMVYS